MKILLSWLKDYVEIDSSAEQTAETLSDLGLACEGIEYLNDDAVIDIEVTSNRGDCLGYIGVARELAAATGKELKLPAVELAESPKDVTDFAAVEIAEPKLCGRYTARIIEGVKIGPSPDWVVKRLEAVGLRSINNVVDATNYAMMETAQPPHAFDYDKITDGKIIVRRAKAGEIIVSIDETKCELDPDMLIIADTKAPVAIAGVMGGLKTEVSEKTKTILLEDAYFDPVTVRATSRKLALPSESSFRFERTVDIEMIDFASKRTAQLITQWAGGKVAKGVIDVYPEKPKQKQVTLRLDRLNKLLGIEIPAGQAVKILTGLNFNPALEDGLISCTVPSWRSDVYREADLIEEVVRHFGYNRIPTETKIRIEVSPVDQRQKFTQSVGTYLNGCGFYETINVSFVDDSVAGLFCQNDSADHLAVKDVSRKSSNLLRRSLIGSLLAVLKTNLNAKVSPCRIFEIANTFVPAGNQPLPIEKTKLTLVSDGDLQDLRGVIGGLVKSMDRTAGCVFTAADLPWADAGAQISVNDEKIGVAGIVSQKVRDKFDFKDLAPVAAEIDFELLCRINSGAIKVMPIPKFPAIERDLSVIVDEQTAWSQIEAAVNKKSVSQLEAVKFVGIYRGKGIPDGRKSVTLSLCFRDEDGTLTHETVDGFEADIVKSLTRSVSAQLRTV